MLLRRSVIGVFTLTLMMSAGWARAAHCTAGCCAPPPCEQPHYVQKTICVPQWTTETRSVMSTVYDYETRQRTVTRYRCVPETKPVTQTYTVQVPEMRTRTVNYTVQVPVTRHVEREYSVRVPVYRDVQQTYQVSVPVYRTVEQQYTAMVPQQVRRSGVRNVCQTVPVTQTRTICRDRGHWETRQFEVPCRQTGCGGLLGRRDCGHCGGCHPCGCMTVVCKRVWVPNIVQEQVPVTYYKTQVVQKPYEYIATVCRPETRTRQVRVCDYRSEQRTRTVKVCEYRVERRTQTVPVCHYETQQRSRQVQYTVCVPQQRTRTYNITTYRQIPEQVTQNYRVCVPRQVQREVQVPVCRMMPKTITVPVACYDCGHGCGRRGLLARLGGRG